MKRLPLVAIAVVLTSCNEGPIAIECTQVGCVSGLRVEFDREVTAGARVEVFRPGQVSLMETCMSDDCRGVIFLNYLPDKVTLNVMLDGKVAQYTNLATTKSVSYPNGRVCGPECRSAKVLVSPP